jgi:DNA polymerase-3 subunit epsilon
MYAIVDIETTGGHAGTGFITEVAIILHNGMEEEGRFQTLVNPGIPIPRYVQSLTGITNNMVSGAPRFQDVAEQIHDLLKGRIFVAHNVNFDYSFIRHHLLNAGIEWEARKLCTVRISRKIFPGHQRYSLGSICRILEIPMAQRHRAMGDAQATAILFTRLVAADGEGHIRAMLKKGSRESYLPMHLSVTDVDQLPHLPGVYYFHDRKNKVIYVGKAKDLRKRVTSHFSNNAVSRRKQELVRNVYRISYNLTGSEFAAIVLESIEIRKHWPRYNQSQKRMEFPLGLFSYEDIQGRMRLGIGRIGKGLQPHMKFGLLTDAQRALWKMVREHELCPTLCFLRRQACEDSDDSPCKGICEGTEDIADYNRRVQEAILRSRDELPSFVILEKGRQQGEVSCTIMEEGRFYGMGFLQEPRGAEDIAAWKAQVTAYPENEFLRSYVRQYAENHPSVIRFQEPRNDR